MSAYSYSLGSLNSKYIILVKIGDGGYSTVYKVQDTITNQEYAAKIIEHFSINELKINEKLSIIQSPYIVKFIEFSQGFIKVGRNEDFKPYYLFELASKGELSNYINCCKNGFKEKYCKIIFYDILKGIQELHKANICHRDIKAQNILLDGDCYKVKICDFSFSSYCSDLQNGLYGTKEYIAPEIIMEKEYDGIKADIFSLGVLLFYLKTNKFLFDKAKVSDNNISQTSYDYIKNKDSNIWEIDEANEIKGLSKEFKKLYLRMVAFNPEERPDIEDILRDDWMKEINDLPVNEIVELRKEVIKEFKRREAIILQKKILAKKE